ncbi:hypothetical protein JXL21_12010 [Candidatus Bathyarchaeota archaeon]|nr:hypothetical protein [Candidatus Bathyarchaeota archaeon]
MNNVSIGEIEAYRVLDKYADDFDIGDLLKGKLLGNKTISHEPGVPFFEHDWDYGFVNRGDLLLFGGARITRELNDPYPVLRFSIKNLGGKEVTAVRAKINEFELPYTFGVSTESPIEPSKHSTMSRYTSWYDPETGNVTGYIPSDGEEYLVEVTVKFDDYSTQVFNRTNIFETEKGCSIATVVGSERVYFREPDLLSLGLSKGGSVSLSFRNVWCVDSLQEIDRLALYIDNRIAWDEEIHIKPTKYFAVTVHIPFDIVSGQKYDVTLVAHSTTGLNSTYTVPTLCQFHRIK